MKVYYSLEDFDKLDNAVVTTGTFDGVHLGHRKILDKLIDISQQFNGESVLLTFSPHPRMVLQPDLELKLLNSIEEKIEQLKKTGLDHLIIHPFTREFSRTTSLDFVRNILVNTIGAKKLVIGYDHHFGRNREGSFEHLKEFGPVYGFDVEEIPAQDVKEITVSSTKIRNAIAQGDLKSTNEYLGYEYNLSGTIVKGDQIGKGLGFPTANILVNDIHKLIPDDGVYAVKLKFQSRPKEQYYGMCNIGMRPTVGGKFKTIETNIFDFDQDVYGENIELSFVIKLRDELRFDNISGLKEQLTKDSLNAKKTLNIK